MIWLCFFHLALLLLASMSPCAAGRARPHEPTVIRTMTKMNKSLLLGAVIAVAGASAVPQTAHAVVMAAPEIDPSSALGALTLLAGALAVMRARKPRK